jgi:hypothetical protein
MPSLFGRGLTECPDCGGVISRQARTCPHCGCNVGGPLSPIKLRKVFWIIVAGMLVLFFFALANK